MTRISLASLVAATTLAIGGCAVPDAGDSLDVAPAGPELTVDDGASDAELPADDGSPLDADLTDSVSDLEAPEHHVPDDAGDPDLLGPGTGPGAGGGPGAPVDPDMPNWTMSVLVQDYYDGDSILMLDADGDPLGEIPTGTQYATNFAWHEAGAFWVVNDGSTLHRVESVGNMGAFIEDWLTWGWRLNITEPDGDVIVSDEYEIQHYDSEGNHVQTSAYDSSQCHMDIAIVDGDQVLSLNVYGVTVEGWDLGSNQISTVIGGVNGMVDYIGADDSGAVWMGGYGQTIWRNDGESTVTVGTLSSMGVDGYSVYALEPASEDSVYVLYAGANEGIVEVSADGVGTPIVEADGALWVDLASR